MNTGVIVTIDLIQFVKNVNLCLIYPAVLNKKRDICIG